MQQTIAVSNIKCGGCANSIKSKLGTISGIESIEVDVTTGEVSFEAADENTVEAVKQSLVKMGYPEDDPTIIQTAKSYVSCMIGRMK